MATTSHPERSSFQFRRHPVVDTNVYARGLAEYSPEYLPEDVNIVVENITGGALTEQLNHVYPRGVYPLSPSGNASRNLSIHDALLPLVVRLHLASVDRVQHDRVGLPLHCV